MTKKQKVLRIVLPIVAAILVVILAVSNYFLNYYSLIIHRFLAGDTVDATSGESVDALNSADKLVREIAGESMVLLKNDNDFLPKKDLKKVNLFGYGSTEKGFLLTGGGSGGTAVLDNDKDGNKRIKVDLNDAFTEAGIEYNTAIYNLYSKYSDVDADNRSEGSTGAFAADSLINPPASFYTTNSSAIDNAKTYSDIAIVTLSRWGAENEDKEAGGELKNAGTSDGSGRKYNNGDFLRLTAEEKAMFDTLQQKSFNVVVLLNTCNDMELGFLDEYSCIKACLFVGIPGQSGAAAIPQILNGTINPSGKTSDIMPYRHDEHNPVYVNATKSGSDLTYQEGIYFGYKWYETADAAGYFEAKETTYGKVVQFPFGYGKSYTEFEWKVVDWGFSTLASDGSYKVKVRVTNKGKEPGRDVVQLYGHAPYIAGGIEKAERVLLDFAKTPMLYPSSQAGEDKPNSAEVELTFRTYDLASYDAYDKNGNKHIGYELDPGAYELQVMYNSHDKFEGKSVTLSNGIKYTTDPDTGKPVGNLFTGSTAYAGCPTDGSNVFDKPVDYLSRNNKFANFPTTAAGAANGNKVKTYVNYRYDGYDNADVSNIMYGVDVGITMVQAKLSDGSTRKPTLEQLNGEDTSVELVFNSDIMELLCDYDNDAVWNVVLGQLSQDDVKNLIGMGGFQTIELSAIGKPRCTDKDGPAGFNNNVTNPGKASQFTVWPSESLLGCSWDKDAARKIGEAQAAIATAMGINGWYGPGVNLHRSVYNARNYEYYSEDAVLSGKLAAQTIAGAKENNLYCYLKHFAVSEAGCNPKNWNTWLTEQTMRESYLRAFEVALKESGGNAVMSAFNRLGATLCGYNHALLTDVLRTEWGFKGSVITDWYTGGGYMEDHTLGVLAGNDLWLCGSTSQAAKLELSDKAVAYAARQSVKNLIYTYAITNSTASSIKVNPEAHSSLFIALWVLLDVVLGLGIAACIAFFTLTFFNVKFPWSKKAKATEGGDVTEQAEQGEQTEADSSMLVESEAQEQTEVEQSQESTEQE